MRPRGYGVTTWFKVTGAFELLVRWLWEYEVPGVIR